MNKVRFEPGHVTADAADDLTTNRLNDAFAAAIRQIGTPSIRLTADQEPGLLQPLGPGISDLRRRLLRWTESRRIIRIFGREAVLGLQLAMADMSDPELAILLRGLAGPVQGVPHLSVQTRRTK